MFLGFFAWYAGLARGGVARIGQVQLAQPLLTVLWSALVLGEPLSPALLLAGVGVLASVAATQRARVAVRPPRTPRAACPNLHGHGPERGALPRGARHPEDDDVVERVAVAVPARQDALAPEPDPLERDLRAAVARVRPRGQPVQPEPLERERRDQRLGLAVRRRSPTSGARTTSRRWRAGCGATARTARSRRSGRPRACTIRKSSSSPRSRLPARPAM